MPADPTFIEILVKGIKSISRHDPDEEAAPSAILWIDPSREWEPILPLLRQRLPVLTLGPLVKDERCGPAIWIRCMLARVMPDRIAPNAVPVIYLPGIATESMINADNRLKELEPLAEIMYSGKVWQCADGNFWSVDGFFRDKEIGVGIEMRDDDFTRKAMLRALPMLGDLKKSQLKDEEPWKAKDFEALADTGVKKLIDLGESSSLEFKSTANWDMVLQKPNSDLLQVILKTVAGFLNSERGGTLLIGVEDNKNVCGIELDYQTFKDPNNHNCDAYERWLVTLLLNAFGKEFASQLHPSFQTLDGKTVCKLVIDPAPEPVFINDKVKHEDVFYLRVGNATNALGVKVAVNYYKSRWASR